MRLLFQSRSGRIQRILPLILLVLIAAVTCVSAAPQEDSTDGDYPDNYPDNYENGDVYDYGEGKCSSSCSSGLSGIIPSSLSIAVLSCYPVGSWGSVASL